jgi:hypothetical protein
MHDPLHRLYRTKLALLATLLLFVGLGLLIFGHWVQHAAGWHWLTNWPIIDIGSGLFTTGLFGVALQYLDGADSEVRDTQRLERVLASSAPAMRDAVIEGFAFKPDDLARVATPETLDQIIRNGLGIRLGDVSFADDVYADVRQQAVGIPERLHDARIAIRLSVDSSARNRRARMFVTTVRWESTLVPQHQTRRFSCVSDIQEFRDLTHDAAANSAWYLGPRTGLDASARASFELVEFTVNGEARTIRRSAKEGSQTYTVNLGREAMEASNSVTIAYTYRTLTSVEENLLQLRVDQPTKGINIEMDYSDCGISHVNVLDFIASSDKARISRTPKNLPGKSVGVEFDGWVFPRSGVAFVWSTNKDRLAA